jgi:hypothetical protein
MTKFCKTCTLIKPFSEFYTHKNSKDGHINHCKTCISEKRKKEYCSEKTRSHNLKSKYKINLEIYEEMLIAQNYRCAICNTTDPGDYHQNFCVDHDHNTGKIRGLLCHNCNSALGNFHDNISTLTNAILYLQRQ